MGGQFLSVLRAEDATVAKNNAPKVLYIPTSFSLPLTTLFHQDRLDYVDTYHSDTGRMMHYSSTLQSTVHIPDKES
jgi:hypothetical protein